MLRVAAVLLGIALYIYFAIDVIRTPRGQTRTLPKFVWLLVVLLLPLLGGLIWLASVLLKVRQNYRDYGRIMDHELVPQFWYSFCFFVVALFVWQIAI